MPRQTKTATTKRKAKDDGELWMQRVEAATAITRDFVEAGERVEAYMSGDVSTMPTFLKVRARKLIKVAPNKFGPLLDAIIPATMHRQPGVVVLPADENDEMKVAEAALKSNLLMRGNREQRLVQHARATVRQGFIYAVGVAETDFDSEREVFRTSHVDLRRVVWDPECNGLPGSMRWAGVSFTMPVTEARDEFDDDEIVGDGAPSRSQGTSDASLNLPSDGSDDARPEYVTLWRVYRRGDSPAREEAKLDASAKTGDNRSVDGYSGENDCIIIDPCRNKILKRAPWGFTLDHDELPLSFFVPVLATGKLATISIFKPLERMHDVLNWIASFIATQIKHTSVRKYLYKKGGLDPAAIKALESDDSEVGVPVPDTENADRLIKALEFGKLSESALTGLGIYNSFFEASSPEADLQASQILKSQKAGVANIANSRSENRLALYSDRVEEFMIEVQRKQSQIADSLMTARMVERVVGPAAMGLKKEFPVPVMGPDGQPAGETMTVAVYPLWRETKTPREIRMETDVTIESGSMRRMSSDEQFQNTLMMFDRSIAAYDGINKQLLPFGQRIKPQSLIRKFNDTLKRLHRLNSQLAVTEYQLMDSDVETVGASEIQQVAQRVDGIEKTLKQLMEAIQQQGVQTQQQSAEIAKAIQGLGEGVKQAQATAVQADERAKKTASVLAQALAN